MKSDDSTTASTDTRRLQATASKCSAGCKCSRALGNKVGERPSAHAMSMSVCVRSLLLSLSELVLVIKTSPRIIARTKGKQHLAEHTITQALKAVGEKGPYVTQIRRCGYAIRRYGDMTFSGYDIFQKNKDTGIRLYIY